MADDTSSPKVGCEKELWLPVKGWEDLYEVSSHGNIRSKDREVRDLSRGGSPRTRIFKGRQLKCYPHSFGYPQLRLCRDGKTFAAYVHHLVAAAFIGPRPDGLEVAHNDGNPANNCAWNLRYATPVENMADCRVHGTHGKGALSRSKLTDDIVREIRHIDNVPQAVLAKRYGVSQSQISCVKRMITWRHVK